MRYHHLFCATNYISTCRYKAVRLKGKNFEGAASDRHVLLKLPSRSDAGVKRKLPHEGDYLPEMISDPDTDDIYVNVIVSVRECSIFTRSDILSYAMISDPETADIYLNVIVSACSSVTTMTFHT